jgi:hypothetical protein
MSKKNQLESMWKIAGQEVILRTTAALRKPTKQSGQQASGQICEPGTQKTKQLINFLPLLVYFFAEPLLLTQL